MEPAFDMIAAHPFLAGLGDYQLQRLEIFSMRSLFHAGNRIFLAGDPADRFWLLVHGKVNLDLRGAGPDDLVVDTLGPGSVLGWSWLHPPYRWHFGAVAVESTVGVQFDAAGVRAMCDADPALGYTLAIRSSRVLMNRLYATRHRLLHFLGAEQRDS